jgi:MscS family membrane protein
MEVVLELLQDPLIHASVVVVGSIVAAWLIELIITKTIAVAASKTQTDLDDKIIEIIRRPIFLTVLLYGLDWATDILELPERFVQPVDSLLKTLLILIWSIAVTRIGVAVLSTLAARERPRSVLQPRTLPVFDMLMRVCVVAGAIYAMFLAWHIDLTAWLASAGIIGIAFGFAAKDTLANLFSGIFILADGPYKVRDWVVLDEKLRGEVTHIGIRSTRILTTDDVEITVPNAIIGNAQCLNETGGPYRRQRVRIPFSVAYGSDVDQVRAVVRAAVDGATRILFEPEAAAPRVRFKAFGDSGLEFELSIWMDDPPAREAVIDDMATRIYKGLNAASIEIPFPKRDIYIKEMPKGLS